MGKIAGAFSRVTGREGAALPGVVALSIHPTVVRDLAAQLSGVIVVAGTNGKTTTSRMLSTLLGSAGFETLRNESGSNLMRGLASALVKAAGPDGRLPLRTRRLGLFEVDEAALPEVLRTISPRTIVLLNLFRDQLDRYGEVATIARVWTDVLRSVPTSTNIVANADDPLVVEVTSHSPGRLVYFGIQSALSGSQLREHAGDVKACPRCGRPIDYSVVYLGHLGHYTCTSCDLRTPTAETAARDVRVVGADGSTFLLQTSGETADVSLPLPGTYNVYNALAAAAAASTFGLDNRAISATLPTITPAFGRMERLEIEGRKVFIALAKNPTGLNEVLRTVVQSGPDAHLLVMLNDRIADGRDVSWIWDADVEMLAGRLQTCVFSGTRAEDMALRFKYAGAIPRSSGPNWIIEHNVRTALTKAVDMTPPDQCLFIIPTYTAMLDARKTLASLGHVRPYWEA